MLRIYTSKAGEKALDIRASRNQGNTGMRGLADFRDDGIHVILDEPIRQTGRVTLLAADQAPDRRTIGRIQLRDTGLLLDDLGAVHTQARLTCQDEVAA